MHKLSFALAAGVVAISASAYAADLGYEPPPVAPPAPVEWNGLYFTVHGGWLWVPDVNAFLSPDDNATFQMTPGYRAGGSIGYDFSSNFGIEGEVSYADFGTDFVTVPGEGAGPIIGDASVLTIMGNVIVGHQWGAFRPYVGVGAGAAEVSANVLLFSGVNDSDWTWAAQAFAGLDFALTSHVSLGIRYRFQYIGDTNMSDGDGDPINIDPITAHSVEGVLKVRFGG
jgi:opacity protein-like surface antigen